MPVKILIVEDEPLISEDLDSILSKEGYQIIGKAYDGNDALDMIHNRKPQIVLLDIHLGHQISGLDIAKIINDKYQIPFIFITSYSDKETLNEAKQCLPSGYIVKPFKKKDIIATLEMVVFKLESEHKSPFKTYDELNQILADNSQLTLKEFELLVDLGKGLTNEKIASKHFISINTVKTHLKSLYSKIDVNSRSQALLYLLK